MRTRVSRVVAAYNGAAYPREAIDSLHVAGLADTLKSRSTRVRRKAAV